MATSEGATSKGLSYSVCVLPADCEEADGFLEAFEVVLALLAKQVFLAGDETSHDIRDEDFRAPGVTHDARGLDDGGAVEVVVLGDGFTGVDADADAYGRGGLFEVGGDGALHIDGGTMSGEVEGEIIDASRKAELLSEIAEREGISGQQTIAIGDGANDLPMLNAAGLGVAYHAKPLVKETASHAISTFGLDSVLYLMGFSDRDISEALAD